MIRKNLRKMQKMKKHEHFTNKRRNKTEPNKQEVDIMPESASVQKTSTRNLNIQEKLPSIKKNIEETTLKKAKKEKMENEIKKQRVKQLRVANKIEDKNIKKIEKQLKLHKRKSKGIPKSFVDDGLDFLLEVCDPEKLGDLVKEEFDFADNDNGFEEDLAMVNSKAEEPLSLEIKKKAKKLKKNQTTCSKDESDGSDHLEEEDYDSDGNEEEEDEEEQEFEEEEGEELDEESEGCSQDESCTEKFEVDFEGMEDEEKGHDTASVTSAEELVPNSEENQYWEDIYGRLRDKKGNVIKAHEQKNLPQSGKYVPPGKRLLAASSDSSVETEKLKRQVKGLLNRLAEANLPNIVSSIEEVNL